MILLVSCIRRCPKAMIRSLLVFLLAVLFSASFDHFTSVKGQEMGTLSVVTTPVMGPIYVDSFLVGRKFWSGDLAVGPHVVSFGNVEGYIAPPQETVIIIAKQTNYVTGLYRNLPSLPF